MQVDNEFEQIKIKDLNDKYVVTIFTTVIRREKVFAAGQKLRELKSRIAKLNAPKMKVPTTTIIL